MPAIPLNVLVAARQALDLVMSDPGVPSSVKGRICFTAGQIAGTVDFILLKLPDVDVTVPPANPDTRAAQLIAALEHAVRFHDQLNPTDIERFQRVLAVAKTAP